MKRLYNQGVKDLFSVNHGENQLRWWTFRQCLCHIFLRQQLHKLFFPCVQHDSHVVGVFILPNNSLYSMKNLGYQ